MINMTTDAILNFMRKNKYEAEIQAETQQVYTIFKKKQSEYPLFIRIFDNGHLLQLLVFIPSHLAANPNLYAGQKGEQRQPGEGADKDKIADLARLLHLLNKELDVPGFGLDEMAGVVFYRLMLPTPKKKIDEDLLLAYLKTANHVCDMFSKPIEAISSGQMTLDQILAKAQELGHKPPS